MGENTEEMTDMWIVRIVAGRCVTTHESSKVTLSSILKRAAVTDTISKANNANSTFLSRLLFRYITNTDEKSVELVDTEENDRTPHDEDDVKRNNQEMQDDLLVDKESVASKIGIVE